MLIYFIKEIVRLFSVLGWLIEKKKTYVSFAKTVGATVTSTSDGMSVALRQS